MLNQYIIPIKKELEEVEFVLNQTIETDIPFIKEAGQYIIANKGKRIRPIVFLLVCRMTGQYHKGFPDLAAGFELIHTASLLHDDVIDDAYLRRGKPSVRAKWGNKISILIGDFLWSRASDIFVQHGEAKLWQKIVKTTNQITKAQVLETINSNNVEIEEDLYKKIIHGKTASLFAMCAEGASIIQGLSENLEGFLKDFGFSVGMAFQLTDDILDFTSTKDDLGKEVRNDLTDGKITLPVIFTLKRCSKQEKELLKEYMLSKHIKQEAFEDIIKIINKYNGLTDTKILAREYIEQAKKTLQVFKPSIEKDALSGIADYIVDRVV